MRYEGEPLIWKSRVRTKAKSSKRCRTFGSTCSEVEHTLVLWYLESLHYLYCNAKRQIGRNVSLIGQKKPYYEKVGHAEVRGNTVPVNR